MSLQLPPVLGSQPLILSQHHSLAAGDVLQTSFPLDSALSAARVNVLFSGADVTATLTQQNQVLAWDQCLTQDESTLCYTLLTGSAFVEGDYQLVTTNNGEQSALLQTQVMGYHNKSAVMIGLSTEQGEAGYLYPQPLVLTVAVQGDYPLTQVHVRAEVTDPLGKVHHVVLNDDGLHGDRLASDGFYAQQFHYQMNGEYRVKFEVDNRDGSAATTLEGLLFEPTIDGTFPPFEPEIINENFMRTESARFIVADFAPDDHGDNNACTIVLADNRDYDGRIDNAQDSDCFVVDTSKVLPPISLRLTDVWDLPAAKVSLYCDNAELDSESYQFTHATGIAFAVTPEICPSQKFRIEVRSAEDHHTPFTYQISAGETLHGDFPLAMLPTSGSAEITLALLWAMGTALS
uniref:choice-of-anchor X domain-containing protein n=1 Tax=Thaumasiovibrio occultus TaxID=1891184 RepID=UPI000B34DD01|nr:choice-of-anchor X domain-containing protein [Thaumasiovibrio occultus]